MKRYHMETIDKKRFIEAPFSVIGKQLLEGLRKGRPELFKNQRVKEVLQLLPNEVPICELVEYTY